MWVGWQLKGQNNRNKPCGLSLCDLPEKNWVQLASQILSRWHPRGSREWWGSPHTGSTFQAFPQVGEENSVAEGLSVFSVLDKPWGNIACNERGRRYYSHLSSNAAAARGCVEPHPHAGSPRCRGQPQCTACEIPDCRLRGPTRHKLHTPLLLTLCMSSFSLCFLLRKQEYSFWFWGVSSPQIWRTRFSPTCGALSAWQTNLYLLALTFKQQSLP